MINKEEHLINLGVAVNDGLLSLQEVIDDWQASRDKIIRALNCPLEITGNDGVYSKMLTKLFADFMPHLSIAPEINELKVKVKESFPNLVITIKADRLLLHIQVAGQLVYVKMLKCSPIERIIEDKSLDRMLDQIKKASGANNLLIEYL